ncbi:transglutaminase-like domain-containing protein [Paludibacterium purpuratum]|uniref:Transglutaminase superfamily protein n=1 Tax=Paludibacterium purpuratum TaxID=1144873 RepID=A0A4R7AYY4_9NEIS|nr:transglutaminase-like domain-containing protein [Paludibacterium purpuratum]TDR73297.1 transglutaminase superfamily protein [Paludibacterium purpuratum]
MTLDDVLQQLRAAGPFDSERERAIAIHDYVRDQIAFGFTTWFETVTPEETLARRRGHCNAQGDLVRALLDEAGIAARLRFVQLDKRVLRQAVPGLIYQCLPPHLFHAVVQAEIDGTCRHVDSYLFTPAVFARQLRQLNVAGLAIGFGVTRDGRCDWQADGDAFCQACAGDLTLADPVFDSLAAAMAARAGNNHLLGLHFNQWLGAVPAPLHKAAESYLNSRLDAER